MILGKLNKRPKNCSRPCFFFLGKRGKTEGQLQETGDIYTQMPEEKKERENLAEGLVFCR